MTHVLLALAVVSAAAAPSVSMSRPATKNTKEIAKMRRQARLKTPRGPLKGAKKSAAVQTIALQTGSNALRQQTVFEVGVHELTDRVGISLQALISRRRDTSDPPVVHTSRVGMSIPAGPQGVYMFDCGVSNARAYQFNIFENGVGTFASGTATSVGDRLVFAHAFTGDVDRFLLVNFAATDDSAFTFSSCEVTELAPFVSPTTQVAPNTATTIAR